MILQTLSLIPIEIPFSRGLHSGVILKLTDGNNTAFGEISPYPNWSQESLEEAMAELKQKQNLILRQDWSLATLSDALETLQLLPSVAFGLESALLSLLDPLPPHAVNTSALLMGSVSEILAQAELRQKEGFQSAKLKVKNLSFEEARQLINALKDTFRLRIDVNRTWSTDDALRFFSDYSLDAFDYIEEPFAAPKDLKLFTHPLAVDESFPNDLSLNELEELPTLKALIYKPTMQGGLTSCLPLHTWAKKRGVDIVLSSSFESDLGLASIASLAHRLSLPSPIGIGTYHHLKEYRNSLQIKNAMAYVS